MNNQFSWIVEKFKQEENPCRYCKPPVRHGGCHAKCELYNTFKNELNRLIEKGKVDRTNYQKAFPKKAVEHGIENFVRKRDRT